jgi:multicomponent Na+:H+ antiporter subunit F
MIYILGAAAAMLSVAAILTLWRLVSGPTPLDRIIASDVIVAIAIAAVALYSVIAGNATGLPIVLTLSLVGFTGAVGVARLISSSEGVRRLFDRRRAMKDDDDR